jgi:hypothetical protein
MDDAMKKPKLYTRLPGTAYRTFRGKYTLWRGQDHLLHMLSNGMSEDYKRYYFKDIQGIVITKTRNASVTSWVIFILSLLTSWYTWYFSKTGNTAAAGFLFTMAIVFIAFLIMLLIKGPSCEFLIITAVQSEKLKAVTYLRHARKLMKIIRPVILEAQGGMDNEISATAVDSLQAKKSRIEKATGPSPELIPPQAEKNAKGVGVFMLTLAAGLILYGILVALGLPQRTKLLVSGAYLFLFIAGMGSAGAVSVLGKSPQVSTLRKIAWGGLVFMIIAFLQSYGEMMIVYFIKIFNGQMVPGDLRSQSEMFRQYYSLSPMDFRFILVMDGLKIAVSILMGIACLFMMKPLRK